MSKSAAVLVALSLFSTILMGVGGDESESRAPPPPNPFGSPVRVNDNTLNSQTLPVIVALPGQKLLATWQDSRSGNEDVYVAVSQDNGTTYSPSIRADDSIGSSKQIEPAVAVSGNGTIMLTWQDNRRGTFDYDIYFTKSYDGGASFSRNVKVDDSNGAISWQERPSIAVTVDGRICIAWTDDRAAPGLLRVRYTFSTDGGATFAPSQEIVPSEGTIGQTGVALVSSGGRIFAAFAYNVTGTSHPYVCVSTDGGQSFSVPTRLDDTGSSGAIQRGVAIAPMPGAGVVAAWEDSRGGDWDIYVTTASANGTVRTPDIRVDDDLTGAYQKSASVASDQLGNIYVVWEDERDVDTWSIRFAYLEVGETQFTASMDVATPKGDDMQKEPSIIARAPGQVVVVWEEDKTLSYDVYSSAGYFSGLFNLQLVRGWNFVSVSPVGFDYRASTLGLMFGDVVAGWNSSTATYDKAYIVGISPPDSDFVIGPNTGYWIYAGANMTLDLYGEISADRQRKDVVVPTGGGWVPVGLSQLNMSLQASNIPPMYSVPGGIPMVASYDADTGTYVGYFAGVPFTDYSLVLGEAYWCWCSESGELMYDP